MTHNQRGALWMLGSAATFVAMASLVKALGGSYPATLQLFYRQLAGTLVVLPLILREGKGVLRSPRPWLVVSRSLLSVTGISLMFFAYEHLPLADANALSFTRPLWVVLLAALLLREPLGARRIVSALAGFAGVLLIVNPLRATPSVASLAALASALVLGWSITGIKSLTSDHSTMTIVTLSALLGLVLSFPLALPVWRWPSGRDLLLLVLMGWFGVVNQMCYVKAMSLGDAGVMAPMDYMRLLFAVLAGWLFFGDLPDARTLVGAGLIIAATLYVAASPDAPRGKSAPLGTKAAQRPR